MNPFPFIDQYLGISLDMDVSRLNAGLNVVIESTRRLRCEPSYGFVHALLGIVFADGRTAFSVMPGARVAISRLLEANPPDARSTADPVWLDQLAAAINEARLQAGLAPIRSASESWLFACNQELVRRHHSGDCRPLHDESIPPAEGLFLPTHCFPDGVVYGIVADEQIMSVAYAHRSGKMEDQVADLGVETAPAYRQRGYASQNGRLNGGGSYDRSGRRSALHVQCE